MRNKIRRGEGGLQPFDLEAGPAHQRRNMTDDETRYDEEKNFRKTFYMMANRVEKLFAKLKKLENVEGKTPEGQGLVHGGDGGDPTPSPSTSESCSSSHQNDNRNSKDTSKKPFCKLDVKFDLPMYNGESNAEKLNNWIRQIEIYCTIQQIVEDEAKI